MWCQQFIHLHMVYTVPQVQSTNIYTHKHILSDMYSYVNSFNNCTVPFSESGSVLNTGDILEEKNRTT